MSAQDAASDLMPSSDKQTKVTITLLSPASSLLSPQTKQLAEIDRLFHEDEYTEELLKSIIFAYNRFPSFLYRLPTRLLGVTEKGAF
uniref:NR LBD domain-containing protein n=1 Tax=Steinernema glaseri TaxID=37863 RepID=A0A1I7Y055_9BILA